ncbi:MAG: MoaD/ThiS family protein [Planctomycetota bacterium]|jgi:molybdopterin converting factor small subunit
MPTLTFTANLLRHVETPSVEMQGDTVGELLEAYFKTFPKVRGYVVDDQGAIRKHVTIFLNGEMIHHREALGKAVSSADGIFVAQALSGG